MGKFSALFIGVFCRFLHAFSPPIDLLPQPSIHHPKKKASFMQIKLMTRWCNAKIHEQEKEIGKWAIIKFMRICEGMPKSLKKRDTLLVGVPSIHPPPTNTPSHLQPLESMNTERYNHGSRMDITGSHLDRELNSFIQETTDESSGGTATAAHHPLAPDSPEAPSAERYRATTHGDHTTSESEDEFLGYGRPSSLRMGGSRPPSRAASTRLRSRATSTCSSFVAGEEESQIPGYLFLHEVPPLRIKKGTATSHPPVLSFKQKEKAATCYHHRRNYSQNSKAWEDIQSHSSNHHTKPGARAAEQILKTPLDVIKSPQHAWYFIRRLVGLELRWEAARAWKLTDLNLRTTRPDRHPSCNPSSEQSDDDKSVYSWDSSSDETTIAAEDLPILMCLIQNFLLTLPIIRDGVPAVPNVINSHTRPNPQDVRLENSASVYWTAGVLPVLRRLHQSNLSAAIDLGSPGFLHILLDLHIGRLLERFIATGLKLCDPRLNVVAPSRRPTTSPPATKVTYSMPDPHSPLTKSHDPRKSSPETVSHKKYLNEPQISDSKLSSEQALKPLEHVSGSSNHTSNREIPYLKEGSFLTSTEGRESNTSVRHTRTYTQNFEKEPMRYSGVSVQPSQRASIEIVTPSTSNMRDSDGAYPSNDKENYPTDFRSHEMQKARTTPSSTPFSEVISSSSTYDQRRTDTEPSTFMPSVFGSNQASLVTPLSQPGSLNGEKIHGRSLGSRKSAASPILTLEERKSVRQTIERLKLMRQNPAERDQVDNKLDVPTRLSRRFSWIRPNGLKVLPSNKNDNKDSLKVSASFDLRQHPSVSQDTQVPYTPLLNKSFRASNTKGSFNREVTENNLDVKEHDLPSAGSSTQVQHYRTSSVLNSQRERLDHSPDWEVISRRNFGSDVDVNDFDHKSHSPRNLDADAIDRDAEEKQRNRWKFAPKSLSLPKSIATARNLQQEKKGFGPLGIKSEYKTSSFSPPSPDALSLKFPRASSSYEADPPLEKVVVANSLVEGLTSSYKSIYTQENLNVRFDTFEILKDSIPWPWGDPVPFWKGTSVHKLSWGGFEVDLVGMRRGHAGNSYIIRVRRPSRLDEFVLRKESQFKKYSSRLSKDFPHAHIRKIPGHDVNIEEIFHLDSLLQEDEKRFIPSQGGFAGEGDSRASFDHRAVQPQFGVEPMSSGNPHFLDPFSNKPLNHTLSSAREGTRRKNTLASLFGVGNHRSKFSVDTRSDWNEPHWLRDKFPMIKNERPQLDREIVGSSRKLSHHEPGARDPADAHRRALRSWLRDTLSIRTVGHHPETATFLLLSSIVPEEKDLLDIRQREKIDVERRNARVQVAQSAAERAQSIQGWWNDVKDEFVNGDGVLNLSTALKRGKTIDELPLRFQKALEWIRMSIAEVLHEIFVTGNQSDVLFGKFLALNAAIPWSLIKNVLKINRPNLMCKALLEVFLTKKLNLGKTKTSVIQRLIEIAMNETEGDPIEVERRIQACRARIQSLTMCEKIIKFVHASKGLKNLFRQYSESVDIELVVAIVRSAEEPRLDRYDLERVMRASKVYRSLLRKNRNRITTSMTENIHVRLILDLKLYLRLISQEWDSRQFRKMFSEDAIIEAVEILISPVLEFFKRTYNIGNAVRALQDAQNFIEQLINVVNALRSRIQDPQKSVRVISRLLARHQGNFYNWLHTIHAHDTIIDEFFEWLSMTMEFLKQGGGEPILVSDIIPAGDLGNLDQELEEIIQWEEAKRQRQYEYLCRRYSADVDGDDPIIIEGDGFGKSKVEPLLDLKPLPPQLDHIASCLELFRRAVCKTFIP